MLASITSGRRRARAIAPVVVVAALALSSIALAGGLTVSAETAYPVTNTITGIPAGPYWGDIDATAGKLYQPTYTGKTLTIIDLATMTIDESVDLSGSGSGPSAALVHAGRVYVTMFDSAALLYVDESTKAVSAPIAVGGQPWAAAYSSASDKIYVTNSADGTVTVVDSNDIVVDTIGVGGRPEGIAVDAAGNVYVANNATGTVSVIDPATDTVVDTVTVGAGPSDVAIDTTTNEAYVENAADDTVTVFSTAAAHTIIATVPVGDGQDGLGTTDPGLGIDAANGLVYVTNSGDDTVSVIDVATHAVIATTAVGADPTGINIDSVNGRVLVSNYGAINGTTMSVITPTVLPAFATLATALTVGVPYSAAVTTAGTPASFTVSSGSLPAGMTLNSTSGVLSGTPTTVGSSTFQISATNAGGTRSIIVTQVVSAAVHLPIVSG